MANDYNSRCNVYGIRASHSISNDDENGRIYTTVGRHPAPQPKASHKTMKFIHYSFISNYTLCAERKYVHCTLYTFYNVECTLGRTAVFFSVSHINFVGFEIVRRNVFLVPPENSAIHCNVVHFDLKAAMNGGKWMRSILRGTHTHTHTLHTYTMTLPLFAVMSHT